MIDWQKYLNQTSTKNITKKFKKIWNLRDSIETKRRFISGYYIIDFEEDKTIRVFFSHE